MENSRLLSPLSVNPAGYTQDVVLLKPSPPVEVSTDPFNPKVPVSVKHAVEQDEFDRVFVEFDRDQNGILDVNEFKNWIKGKYGLTEVY